MRPSISPTDDPATARVAAIKAAGGARRVALARGLRARASVYKWAQDGVPPEHVIWLCEQCEWKFTPHMLSPNLYPHPDDGLPVAMRIGGDTARLIVARETMRRALAYIRRTFR